MDRSCENCLFREDCEMLYEFDDCDFFAAVNEDDYCDELVEEGRHSFRGEWFTYIKEFED